LKELKKRLDIEVAQRNVLTELSSSKPDPLMVARQYQDEVIALACALYAYGNAKAIVNFLNTLDFSLLKTSDELIRQRLCEHIYRFQNGEDTVQFFITLKRLREEGGVYAHFIGSYQNGGLISGLNALIETLYALNPYRSYGYEFLIGKPVVSISKAGAMKRWMMYFRWMVRRDELDMGLWDGIRTKDLIMPLDTHTFNVSKRLGLLNRSQCNLRSAIELTEKLIEFDPEDPVKYDFALYRLGQEKLG